jgi:hypothetical protein
MKINKVLSVAGLLTFGTMLCTQSIDSYLFEIRSFEKKYEQIMSLDEKDLCFWATNKQELKVFMKDMRKVVKEAKKLRKNKKTRHNLDLQQELYAHLSKIQKVHDTLQFRGFIKKYSGWRVLAFIGFAVPVIAAGPWGIPALAAAIYTVKDFKHLRPFNTIRFA